MKRYILLILLFPFALNFSYGQISREKLMERVQEIDEYIVAQDYKEALGMLLELRSQATENANLDFKTGYCYINTIAEKAKAFTFLKQASSKVSVSYDAANPLENSAPVDTWLYLGDAYRLDNKFEDAIGCYKKYGLLSGMANANAQTTTQNRIRECHVAKVLISHPVNVKWQDLGENINQGMGNLNPVVSADGKTMVFTRKMKFYDALYYSTNENGTWKEPINITTHIGSDGEFYPTGLSADGTRLLLSSYDMMGGADIFESTFSNSGWTKLGKLKGDINTRFTEVNASYAPDGNTIYFASNRDNGYGGFDIYYSTKKQDGSWSEAINMGPVVNTSSNEKLPRIINGGKQLSFISQGHLNMGGYDLFYVDLPLTASSKPANFGYPLSTTDDNISFYPGSENTSGYIAKHESDITGETDIYLVNYKELSVYQEVPVKARLEISGLNPTIDSLSLILRDKALSDTIDNQKIAGSTRDADFLLYPGDFTLLAETSDKRITQSSFSVPSGIKDGNYQVPLAIRFTPTEEVVTAKAELVVKNDTFLVKNITFSFNSHTIGKEYLPVLDQLADLLKKHNEIALDITGYSDAIGKMDYNKKLSLQRAEEAKDYLGARGVSLSKINVKGAGSEHFIAINKNKDGSDNPEGRRYNRRIEFKLTNLPEHLIILTINEVPGKLKTK